MVSGCLIPPPLALDDTENAQSAGLIWVHVLVSYFGEPALQSKRNRSGVRCSQALQRKNDLPVVRCKYSERTHGSNRMETSQEVH